LDNLSIHKQLSCKEGKRDENRDKIVAFERTALYGEQKYLQGGVVYSSGLKRQIIVVQVMVHEMYEQFEGSINP
jgi:hypothetical protein